MFLLAIAVLAAPVNSAQIMAGPAFERFAAETDRACPARQLRTITPGDLSWEQETFEEQLAPAQKKRLAAVNRSDALCRGRDGLSCPTGETLRAMIKAKMLGSFSAFACAHPQP